jgi:pimeloyl-ACP methyl ester carboxylesterase
MATQQPVNVTPGKVATEGDDLYYEMRGRGRPLLLIPGALGDAGIYTFVAELVADEFRVITYDRRGQSRSTRNSPQNFEISQEARDAVAVLHAAGEESAIVFGNSSGAIIALEMTRSAPATVQALIAHEPPALRVLPDADEWLALIADVYLTALTVGHAQALAKFMGSIAIPPTPPDPELYGTPVFQQISNRQRANSSSEFAMRHEVLPSSRYLPDVAALRRSGVRIFMAIGEMTQEAGAYYGRTAPILAEQLGCELVVFPGHHGSYLVNPREWTATLRGILHKIGR